MCVIRVEQTGYEAHQSYICTFFNYHFTYKGRLSIGTISYMYYLIPDTLGLFVLFILKYCIHMLICDVANEIQKTKKALNWNEKIKRALFCFMLNKP